MPRRAPRVCPHCGGTHASGEVCAVVAARNAERKAKHDAARPSARERGYDTEWERARKEYLLAYPCCRRCGGRATLVDHVVSIRLAPHRRLDRANFQSLCQPCHSGWKQSQERTDR